MSETHEMDTKQVVSLIELVVKPLSDRMGDIGETVKQVLKQNEANMQIVRNDLATLRRDLFEELAKKADKGEASTGRIERMATRIAREEINRRLLEQSQQAVPMPVSDDKKNTWAALALSPQGMVIAVLIFVLILLLIFISAMTGRNANDLVPMQPNESAMNSSIAEPSKEPPHETIHLWRVPADRPIDNRLHLESGASKDGSGRLAHGSRLRNWADWPEHPEDDGRDTEADRESVGQ